MSNTEVIASLCAIIEQQNEIIKAQAADLEQLGAMAQEEQIAAARAAYAKTMGEEAPT